MGIGDTILDLHGNQFLIIDQDISIRVPLFKDAKPIMTKDQYTDNRVNLYIGQGCYIACTYSSMKVWVVYTLKFIKYNINKDIRRGFRNGKKDTKAIRDDIFDGGISSVY